jgi:hypothetical protein
MLRVPTMSRSTPANITRPAPRIPFLLGLIRPLAFDPAVRHLDRNSSPPDTGRAMSQEEVEFLCRVFDAWSAGDLDAVVGSHAVDVEVQTDPRFS